MNDFIGDKEIVWLMSNRRGSVEGINDLCVCVIFIRKNKNIEKEGV